MARLSPQPLERASENDFLARACRWLALEGEQFQWACRAAADRRRLLEFDDRLLRDVGLTRPDVRSGAPFQVPRTARRKRD